MKYEENKLGHLIPPSVMMQFQPRRKHSWFSKFILHLNKLKEIWMNTMVSNDPPSSIPIRDDAISTPEQILSWNNQNWFLNNSKLT